MARRFLQDTHKAHSWFHAVPPNKPIGRHSGNRHLNVAQHELAQWSADELQLLEQAFGWQIKTAPESLLSYVREHPAHQRRPSTLFIAGQLTQQIIKYQTKMLDVFTDFTKLLAKDLSRVTIKDTKAPTTSQEEVALALAITRAHLEEVRLTDEIASRVLQEKIDALTEKLNALAETAYEEALLTGTEYASKFFDKPAVTPKQVDTILEAKLALNAKYMQTSLMPDIVSKAAKAAAVEGVTSESFVEVMLESFTSRFASYSMPLWGMGAFGFGAEMTAQSQQLWWIVTSSNPCSDCPDLEDESPYDDENPLPTYPGWGDTECRSNCLCLLVTSPALTLRNGDTAPWAPGKLEPVKCAWGFMHVKGNDCHDAHTGQFCSDGDLNSVWTSLNERINKADGGFTVQPVTKEEPKTGFAVSIYPDRTVTFASAGKMSEAQFVKFVRDNKDILTQKDHYIGGWHDPSDGTIYLDVSVVKSTEDDARALAIKNNQISYFDFKNGRSVNVEKREAATANRTSRKWKQTVPNGALREADWKETVRRWSRETPDVTRREVITAYAALTALTKYIVHRGNEWCVVSHTTGRNLGCYPTRAQAVERLQQIEAHKHDPKGAKYSDDQARDDHGRWTEEGFAPSGPEYQESQPSSSVDVPMSNHQATAVASIEPEIRTKGTERCAIYGEDGVAIVDKLGNVTGVQFEKHEMDKLAGVKNLVGTHNHPGGRSLSIDDMRLAAKLNMQEIRAVGMHDGKPVLYRMSRGSADKWPTREQLDSAVADGNIKEELKLGPKVKNGTMEADAANFLYAHEVNIEVAAKLGLHYQRVYHA